MTAFEFDLIFLRKDIKRKCPMTNAPWPLYWKPLKIFEIVGISAAPTAAKFHLVTSMVLSFVLKKKGKKIEIKKKRKKKDRKKKMYIFRLV